MARVSRTAGRRHPDIPLLPTPLIGRRLELATAREYLVSGARLLTLTGPPGVGKTSLALALCAELHERFVDGSVLIDLAPVTDVDLVATTIADALGVSGRREPVGRLIGMLRNRDLLLVLDNFEQVVHAAPVVADLLAACSALTIIATSRIPLRLRWERELQVPPLHLPDLRVTPTAGSVAQVAAVQLFVERARAIQPGFAVTDSNASDIAGICVRLDGLPLAIELAAARSRILTPAALLRQLTRPGQHLGQASEADGRALGLLADGPRDLPPRQRTLRDAITWSHALLESGEQRLFRRLAVFADGCTVEAAEQVCEANWAEIVSLVEKSLLRLDHEAGHRGPDDAQPRVRMLEMVREYALEQLAVSGEADAIRQRHLGYFVRLAEAAEPNLRGSQATVWLTRLEEERGNLQTAERWATVAGDVESVLRLGAALFRFWRTRSDEASARVHIDSILALATAGSTSAVTVKAFAGAGELAMLIGEYPAAQSLFEQSLDVARQLDDPAATALALRELSKLAGYRGRYDEASRLGTESLAILEHHGDLAGLVATLRELGMIHYLADDPACARTLLERGLKVARQLDDKQAIGNLTFGVALTYHVTGQLEAAQGLYEICLATDRALGHRSAEGSALNNLGHLAIMRGDLSQARSLLRASLVASREGGDHRRLAFALSAAAGFFAATGEAEQAIRLDAAGIAALATMGATLASSMRRMYDEQLQPARHALGGQGVVVALAAGRAMSLEQAVDAALFGLNEPTTRVDSARQPADARRVAVEGTAAMTMTPRSSDAAMNAPVAGQVLTRREREVAALLAHGLTNRQIAEALVISERTAGNYVQRVMERLDLHNRVQVAAWAVEQGLRQQPPPHEGTTR